MKAFLKKHRFKIVLTVLLLIFIYVCFYMLWVHVPYASRENDLVQIRQEICQEHDYLYQDEFYEYYGKSTYYILKVEEDDEDCYVVFDEELELVETFDAKLASQEDVENAFVEKYNGQAQNVTLGYENNTLVYALTYRQDDILTYAYYNANDGEFIKAYIL